MASLSLLSASPSLKYASLTVPSQPTTSSHVACVSLHCTPGAMCREITLRASPLSRAGRRRHESKYSPVFASQLNGDWLGKGHLGFADVGREIEQWEESRCGRRAKGRRGLVQASLLGVGAPEALVIGVVALIVFGPKGLAELARNLGKTLKAFQPTIRELQDVSREFRDTLQQEIGLDDLRNPSPSSFTSTTPPPPPPPIPTPTPTPTPTIPTSSSTPASATAPDSPPPPPPPFSGVEAQGGYTADDLAKITEQQLKAAAAANTVSEEARRASELAAWKGSPPLKVSTPAAPAASSASPTTVQAPPTPPTQAEATPSPSSPDQAP